MSWWRPASRTAIENLANEFAAQFKGQFHLDTNQSQTIEMQKIQTLKIDNEIVSDTNIVTAFSQSYNCSATVFVKYGNDFIRISTTLKRPDGSYALGTILDHNNPAYDKIINGENFTDIVNLYGVEFITRYTPIFDAHHNLIGILFVGLRRKSFREARAFQICMVFSTALFIQLFTQNPHVAWIGFTVMLIYAGFAKGASLQRTRERVLGVILGLFIGFFVWLLGQIDFRLAIISAPMLIFMTVYFIGKNFTYQSAFIVSLSVLGVDYYSASNAAIGNFLFDYLIFTLVAFTICVIYDHVIFRKENLTRKFYFDLQEKIIAHLNKLFIIVTHQPTRHSRYLKESNQFNVSMLDLYAFIESAKYDIQNKTLKNDSVTFREDIQIAYHNIRKLFLQTSIKNDRLILETKQLLEEIEKSVYST